MKPHRQSEHMVGYKVPPSFEGDFPFAFKAALAVIAVLILLNKCFPNEPAPVQCAQVAAIQK